MTSQKTQDRLPADIHILLVDDCEVNQFVAQQYLERSGYRVDIAENGQQAVQAHKQQQYDLILMDLIMPNMDGYEAARRIRSAECGLRRAQSSRMRNKKRKDIDLKSEVPEPDHKCECRGNTDQPEKHSCSQKDCKCSSTGTVRNAKSEIRNLKSEIEKVPIVGMSGHDPDSVMDMCLQAGMNDCIGKPLQRESLVSIVRKWTAGASEIPQDNIIKRELGLPHQDKIEHQPPIDIQRTITEFMGKTDLLLEVIETFKVRVRAQILNIKQYLSANNYNSIFTEAHAIKGGAGNLGAFKLSRAAAELEEAAGQESSAKANSAVNELEKEFQRLNQYLEQSEMDKAVQE